MDYLAILERIEARLKEINMGKMAFYESVNISPNSFSLWKKGDTKPSNDNLERIAAVLGLELQVLMFGEKEKAPSVSREDLKALDKLNRLDESDRRYIEGMIDAYLSRH